MGLGEMGGHRLVEVSNHVTAVIPHITAVTSQPVEWFGKMHTSINVENANTDARMHLVSGTHIL